MTVDSAGLGTWQIIQPAATTNLVTNPSFETNTTGWTATSSTITRTVAVGVFGGYGGRMLASALNGKISFTTAAVASGSLNALSMWVKASSTSVTLKGTIGATTASQAHPGDGLFHRLEVSITAPSATTPVLEIIDGRSSAWTNVDVDGAQVETGVSVASTYIDGDQPGCTWAGTVHGSTSARDGRDPRGGAITSLTSLGWTEKTWGGVGAPDSEAISQELALFDGAAYQNQRAQSRVITISALATAANLAALHAARRALLSAINPNTRTSRGPLRLRYAGAATPKVIDVVNETGGGFDKPFHQKAELANLRFLAPDPVWSREIDEQASLTVGQTLSPVNNMALKNADGTWSTLGGGVTQATAFALGPVVMLLDGRTVVGGNMLDFGGTAANDYLAVWNGTSWSTLGGAAPNNIVYCGVLGLDGKLFVSGDFTSIGGVAINRTAQWTPSTNAWTEVGAGGTSHDFAALALDPATGYIWGVGAGAAQPTTAGGVTIDGVGYWTGSAWVAANAGLPGSWTAAGPQALAVGPDGRMYFGTDSASTDGVYVWTGSTWTLFSAETGAGTVIALETARSQLIVGGTYGTLGGVAVGRIASASPSGIAGLGAGVVGGSGGVRSLAATADGLLYAAGDQWTTVGGITPPDSIAVWNGSSWTPFGANPPDTGTHANDQYFIRSMRDGSLLVAWFAGGAAFGTTMPTEAITSVTNSGTANAYPIIEVVGAGTLYTIANLTTGQRLSFSGCTLIASETARLDLRPGRKTFGAIGRTLLPTILPGSDLSTFCLAPGVNRISMMLTAGSATISWRAREWTVD